MNEKEIAEIRRRYRQGKSSVSHIVGCYVNEKREIVARFDQSLTLSGQEESDKFLALLRRTLSGQLGKHLIDIMSMPCSGLCGIRPWRMSLPGKSFLPDPLRASIWRATI